MTAQEIVDRYGKRTDTPYRAAKITRTGSYTGIVREEVRGDSEIVIFELLGIECDLQVGDKVISQGESFTCDSIKRDDGKIGVLHQARFRRYVK